mgnify:FL=1
MDDLRSFDHQALEVPAVEACWDLVANEPVGRIGFMSDGQPAILPVNHGLLGHRVVIRTARGALLHEALMNRPVAFEVDGFDAEARTGWSVLVRGVVEPLHTDVDPREMGLDAWADAVSRDDLVVLLPDEISGRRIVRRGG